MYSTLSNLLCWLYIFGGYLAPPFPTFWWVHWIHWVLACDNNSPRISTTSVSWPSFSSMIVVRNILCSAIVGDESSSLFMIACCFFISTHDMYFISLIIFTFYNISDCSASFFWSFVRSCANMKFYFS